MTDGVLLVLLALAAYALGVRRGRLIAERCAFCGQHLECLECLAKHS